MQLQQNENQCLILFRPVCSQPQQKHRSFFAYNNAELMHFILLLILLEHFAKHE